MPSAIIDPPHHHTHRLRRSLVNASTSPGQTSAGFTASYVPATAAARLAEKLSTACAALSQSTELRATGFSTLPSQLRRPRHPARRLSRDARRILQSRHSSLLTPIRHRYKFSRHRNSPRQKCNLSSSRYRAIDTFSRNANQPRHLHPTRQRAHHPRRSRLRHPAVPHRPNQLHTVHRHKAATRRRTRQHSRHTAPSPVYSKTAPRSCSSNTTPSAPRPARRQTTPPRHPPSRSRSAARAASPRNAAECEAYSVCPPAA